MLWRLRWTFYHSPPRRVGDWRSGGRPSRRKQSAGMACFWPTKPLFSLVPVVWLIGQAAQDCARVNESGELFFNSVRLCHAVPLPTETDGPRAPPACKLRPKQKVVDRECFNNLRHRPLFSIPTAPPPRTACPSRLINHCACSQHFFFFCCRSPTLGCSAYMGPGLASLSSPSVLECCVV